MSSSKQLEANQRNARKSTGPRTAQGKAASSRNAFKHGVLSTKSVIANSENREVYEALRERLFAEFEPASAVECNLVERLTNLFWRERRLAEVEASAINANSAEADMVIAMGATPIWGLGFEQQLLVGRYQSSLGRQIRDALHELREEQKRRVQVIEQAE